MIVYSLIDKELALTYSLYEFDKTHSINKPLRESFYSTYFFISNGLPYCIKTSGVIERYYSKAFPL